MAPHPVGADEMRDCGPRIRLQTETLKNHMSRILTQLDAVDRREAVKTVRECGYEMSL